MRIAKKLSLLLVTIIAAATLGITWFVYRTNIGVLEGRLADELKRNAAQTIQSIDRFLYERNGDIQILATDPVICSPSASRRDITERLLQYRNSLNTYISLSVFDLDRRTIADSAGLTIGEQHPFDLYWPVLIQDGIYIGRRVYPSWSLGVPVIHFATAVKDAGGNIFRYVVARIPLGKLHELTVSLVGYRASMVELTQADGLLIYSSINRKGILKDNLRDAEYFNRAVSDPHDVALFTCYRHGVEEIVVSAKERGYLDFKGNDWRLFIHVPVNEVFKPAIELRKMMVITLVPIMIICALVTAIFSVTITRPLERLRNFAARVGEGELDERIEYVKKDEIGDVTRALNEMTRNLKSMQEALRLANQSLSAIFIAAPLGVISIDLDRIVRSWNPAAEKIFGWKAEETIGRELSYVPDNMMRQHLDLLEVIRKGSFPPTVETERLRKDGSLVAVSLSIAPMKDPRGQVNGYVGILMDITDRKRSEKLLRLANMYNRTLIEINIDPLVTIGHDGKITDVNTATEQVTGYKRDELIGKDFSNYFTEPEKARAGYQKVFKDETVRDYELTIRHRDGTPTDVLYNASVYKDETGNVAGVFAAARNITRRKKAEESLRKAYDDLKEMHEQLVQTEKMAVAGRFAAGAAHEINNPLAYIMGNLTVLKGYLESIGRFYKAVPFDYLPVGKKKEILNLSRLLKIPEILADLPGLISETHEGAERIQNIMQGLILFTAKERAAREPLDVNECLAVSLDALSSRLKGKVHVVREFAKVPPVVGCRADIVHALTNILLNAAEAIGKDGMITVTTCKEGDSVVVKINDTGCGIPPEIIPKIFEPFFSTKESRKGVGLGLAIVHGIIERHNGTIEVKSEVGKGSTFIIRLPVVTNT